MTTIDTDTETAVEAPEGPAARRGRRAIRVQARVRRRVAVLLALAFFFGPAGAYLAGQRPEEIENRRLKPMPSPSEGWRFFPDFAAWAVDHLPLRKQAVQANSALSERVFHEPPAYGGGAGDTRAGPVGGGLPGTGQAGSPSTGPPGPVGYPPVIQGRNGWLYYGGDAANPCLPAHSVDDTLARLRRLAHAVRTSGRRFLLVIPPDKSTVVPQNLPATFLGKSCMTARKQEFWAKLRAAPPPGYVDLRGPIEAVQRAAGQPAYRQTDTHWADQAGIRYARELADALRPGLWNGTQVRPNGTTARTGDLGVLIGRPHPDPYPSFSMVRPGVQPQYAEVPVMPFATPVTLTATTTGAPLFGPRTLLLGDSFSDSSRRWVPQLFANLTLLHNEAAGARPQLGARAIASSAVVVYEIVERTISSGRGTLIDDKALRVIEATLAAHPRR